jgi:hypothetical protein
VKKRSVVLGLIAALVALLAVSILGAVGTASAGEVGPQSMYKAIE